MIGENGRTIHLDGVPQRSEPYLLRFHGRVDHREFNIIVDIEPYAGLASVSSVCSSEGFLKVHVLLNQFIIRVNALYDRTGDEWTDSREPRLDNNIVT